MFDEARKELRRGTPESRERAVIEACKAVESAMKVLLDEHKMARPKPENLQKLFEALKGSGVVPPEAEEMVVAAGRFGNRKGRHGPGPVPHAVTEAEAEAVVSGAAVSITLLARLLP